MAIEFMEVTYDKFVFTARKDCLYHPDEYWLREEGGLLVMGLTDYQQKTAGDVAFMELPEAGLQVARGDELGAMETIKTTVTLVAPVSGTVREVNAALDDDPQGVNADPYGEGWLLKLEPNRWAEEKADLLAVEDYFPRMEEKIKQEME